MKDGKSALSDEGEVSRASPAVPARLEETGALLQRHVSRERVTNQP